jgi:Ser-tRNA(Ala) deacylase AlaX
MTRKVFWDSQYQTELNTTVRAVAGSQIELEETIFFAFSGGQESDSGSIGGHPVLRAEKEGMRIVYSLASDHGLKVGDPVQVRIDWGRRYRLMRLHFAAEMVLQIVYQLQPDIERIGAHISPDKARIDFASDVTLAPLFPEIEQKVSLLVRAALPIRTAFSDLATERRFWEVTGFARMACGGTHPRTTAEIGALRLKRKNTGKGKERIEVLLVEDAEISTLQATPRYD